LLTAADNTVYENCVDYFVKMTENSIPYMLTSMEGYTYDEYMTHWMAHITVDSFIHLITHEKDITQAKMKMRKILNYLIEGWVGVCIIKENNS